MRGFNEFIIVTSMRELCRWLQKEDIEIIGIYPIKGIAHEDIVKIEYRILRNEG